MKLKMLIIHSTYHSWPEYTFKSTDVKQKLCKWSRKLVCATVHNNDKPFTI